MPPPLGLPAPIKPVPELLGEVLITLGRPAEAVPFFDQALQRNPNRSLSVLGLARASAAAGNTGAAHAHYRALLANFAEADAGLPLVGEARAALASNVPSPVLPVRLEPWRDVRLIAAAALATITLIVYIRAKAKKRGPVARAPRRARSKRRR